MADEQVRVFVAIELPEEIKRHLADLQQKLQSMQPAEVRWVRPEGIHVTLKFLGGVPGQLIPKIEMAIARGCEGAAPFSLQISGLGAFPNKSRPRVIWVGVTGDLEALRDLQARFEGEFEKLGFAREQRPFSPHLTLGRVEETVPGEVRRKIGELASSVTVGPSLPLEVTRVSLMRSKLMHGGAIYTQLASIAL